MPAAIAILPLARLVAQVGRLLLTAGFALTASAAHAGRSVSALEQVGVSLQANAQVPLRLGLTDENGAYLALSEAMKDRSSVASWLNCSARR
jgi:hypothetical protein